MIPTEAVEVTAKYLSDFAGTGANNWEWHVDGARELLEAAAPYMLAEALREVADKMRNERANWCLDDTGRYWIGRTLNELTEYADDLRSPDA